MRIATLCGMGFGTSMMLKLSIQKILDAEGIKAEIIPWDLGSFKGQKVDLVVAPTDMRTHLAGTGARVVLIRNLVDKTEIRDKVLAEVRELLENSSGRT
jgi:ascorbate PTS system EIIB component